MQVFLNYTKKAIKLREMVGERFKPFGFSDISYKIPYDHIKSPPYCTSVSSSLISML